MKKGFTLIELLAVIVILAILALIVSPIISGVITNAKMSAAARSLEGYAQAVELAEIKYQTEHQGSVTKILSELSVEAKSKSKVTVNTITIGDSGIVDRIGATVDGYSCTYNKDSGATCVSSVPSVPSEPSEPPVSFAEDSWDTIASVVHSGQASEIYHVGDTKTINLGETYGEHTVRIANLSTPADCSNEGYSQTACGFVVEFADIIMTRNMSTYSTNFGGYPESDVYMLLQNEIWYTLPSELVNVIADTYVVSSHGSDDITNFTSTDKLYLLSTKEIYGKEDTSNPITYDTAEEETRQLDYYNNLGVTTESYEGAIKYNTIPSDWWVRSANSMNELDFYYIKDNGEWDYSGDSDIGVSPAFRIE